MPEYLWIYAPVLYILRIVVYSLDGCVHAQGRIKIVRYPVEEESIEALDVGKIEREVDILNGYGCTSFSCTTQRKLLYLPSNLGWAWLTLTVVVLMSKYLNIS